MILLWQCFLGDTEKVYDGKFSRLELMEKNLCHQEVFYRRALFGKFGKFDTEYRTWAGYKRAVQEGASRVPNFTGINSPYEQPLQPELVIDTITVSLEDSVERILQALESMRLRRNSQA